MVFVVPTDYKVKLKESEKIENNLNLTKELKLQLVRLKWVPIARKKDEGDWRSEESRLFRQKQC